MRTAAVAGLLAWMMAASAPLAWAGPAAPSTPPAAGTAAVPGAPEVKARSAVLIDANTGKVLYEKDAHEPLPPASVTKIMTLVLALEALQRGDVKWEDVVVVSPRAASMGGSQVWLEVGEQMTLRELLYAVAVGSANDAAVAVAEYLAGSEEAFADMMNKRAGELGAKNTQFSNASGLPPRDVGILKPHLTTAYDLAVISRHAVRLPQFVQMVSTWEYTMRPETIKRPVLYNFNRMLARYPGMDGIKTGMTSESGYCISASALRDGLRLIAVTLGNATPTEREQDVRALLDWGFRRYQALPVVRKGEKVASLPVGRGQQEQVELVAAEDVYLTVERGQRVQTSRHLELSGPLLAPVAKEQQAGLLRVTDSSGAVLAEVGLVTAQEVARSSLPALMLRTASKVLHSVVPPPPAQDRTGAPKESSED